MTRTVRTATASDLPDVLGIEQAAHRPGDAALWLPAALADPRRRVLVAVEEGRILGWAKTHYYPDAVDGAPGGHYLGGLTVHPGFHRSGIATALTLARCAWIADRAAAVHCFVSAGNQASLALHRRLGFTEVARASSFHGTAFDAGVGILLTRALGDTTPDARQPPSAPEGADGGCPPPR